MPKITRLAGAEPPVVVESDDTSAPAGAPPPVSGPVILGGGFEAQDREASVSDPPPKGKRRAHGNA